MIAIKGRQIQKSKRGEILLTLHRIFPDRPETLKIDEWKEYLDKQDFYFQVEQTPHWWQYTWPRVKDEVNRALFKGTSEVVMQSASTWIRIGDDISISVYAPNSFRHYATGPFEPGRLISYIRFPIEWWNENIDDLTDELQTFAIKEGT